jgi:ATP-binding cassette subfamily B protein
MIFGKHINRYYIKHLFALLLGLVSLVAVDYFQLKIPELYRMVINGANEGVVDVGGTLVQFDMDFVWEQICKPMFLIIVIMVIGRFMWRMCFLGSGIKVERDLRQRMFDHCKDLSLQYYHRNKVGNLMSLFTNDIETVQECFSWGILQACDIVFLGGMAIAKMFVMNWVLALLSLIPMAFLVTIGIVVGKYLTLKWDARQAAFSNLSDFAQESFSGVAVIKAFVKEFKELWAFQKLNRKNENANIAYTKLSVTLHVCVSLFIESTIAIILGYGGYLVHEDVFDAGMLMEFIGYFNSIIWPMMAITEMIDMSSRGKASLNRVSELLDTKQDVADKPTAKPIDGVQGQIEFKNLTFVYPDGDYNALTDVSFSINAGELVGVVGKTGSGKTTVADVILRCYNVPDGTVFVDGKDVNDIQIDSLRDYCAYVPQDNFLFSDTISANIAFATDNITQADIEKYAELADVHGNIVEFTNGYETILGERGVTLSGGQKQRVSIARALIKDAPILILDDSVSAVDTNTEKIILQNLRNTRQGKTTLLIAHRISTVQDLDKIILLDDGKVVDVGTHQELLSRCHEYKVMVELQKLDDEKKGDN